MGVRLLSYYDQRFGMLGVILFFTILPGLSLSLFTPNSPIEEECINCTTFGWGYRYFKSLYPVSPVEYICLNSSRLLPYGSLVVEVIRKPEDCQDIQIRMPSRNMTDFDDFSSSYNLIDDIFIILGGDRNSSKGGGYFIPTHQDWYWPCISKTLVFTLSDLI